MIVSVDTDAVRFWKMPFSEGEVSALCSDWLQGEAVGIIICLCIFAFHIDKYI